jgi:hypothetical protein
MAREVSANFRTTPIKSTIKKIRGLPNSAILYKCAASSYWQFRVFLEGKPRKRSTKEGQFDKAERQAKLIYADMLASVNASETKAEPISRKTLQMVANSLWAKNETCIKNGELHKDKVSKDRYVFEKHIKPFFGGYDINKIDADLLEQFKGYLADQELSVGSQLSYINVVIALLKEAQIKRLITRMPPKPRTKLADERAGEPGTVRGRLLELGIRIPVDGMRFEREQDMLALLSEVLVPSRKAHGRRSKHRTRRAR